MVKSKSTGKQKTSSPSLEFMSSLAIANAAQKNLVAAIFMLLFIVAMVAIYIMNKPDSNDDETKPGLTEGLVGNVGGGGIYENDDTRVNKGLKPQLCYTDVDCPDQTTCGSQGMCIPRMHILPKSRHMMKMGMGRDDEKAI